MYINLEYWQDCSTFAAAILTGDTMINNFQPVFCTCIILTQETDKSEGFLSIFSHYIMDIQDELCLNIEEPLIWIRLALA